MNYLEKELFEMAGEKWGEEAQLIKAIEELNELSVEIAKVLNNGGDRSRLIDELADAGIMVDQVKTIFNLFHECDKRREVKIKRLWGMMDD